MNVSGAENKKQMKPEKREAVKKAGCYGMIGRHYDFTVQVTGIHEWSQRLFVEGEDRLGRKMLIRFEEGVGSSGIEAGASLFCRGLVLAHDTIFGVPFTFIEATSKPTGL